MTADYGIRAARAINELLPPRHRDKLVQSLFDCSLRMAKYLRSGQGWTIDRLNQASATLGAGFDVLLAGGESGGADLDEIAARLARLEERFDEMVGESATVIPPSPGAAADGISREVPPPSRERAAA